MIEGEYGRALMETHILKVSRTNKIYALQTYAEITGISPSRGSNSGSTYLTITGRNFDPKTTKVTIAGEKCNIVEIDDNQIICKTPPKPTSLPSKFPGNRGLRIERWDNENSNFANLEDIRNMTNPTYSNWTDEAYLYEKDRNNYVTRMRGFFMPPVDSEYVLKAKGDDAIKVYLSKNETTPDSLVNLNLNFYFLTNLNVFCR